MSAAGDALSRARRKAGLTQTKLADLLNREQSFVARIERGKRRVEVREFLWIASRLDVDPFELLSELLRSDFHDLQERTKDRTNTETDRADLEDADDQDEDVLGHLNFQLSPLAVKPLRRWRG
jgi:transcriptional regulator with XRE-family HTH domain